MQTARNETVIIRPSICIGIAVAMLLIPLNWILSWLLAAFVHEVSHYIALKACKIFVYSVDIGITGATMKTEPVSRLKELLCALAGPVGGCSLLLFYRLIPCAAICAFVQSAYNMLPIFPLDGGRVVRNIANYLFPGGYAITFSKAVEYSVIAALFILSLVAVFRMRLGPVPLIAVLLLFLKSKQIKFPCKQRKQIVQ